MQRTMLMKSAKLSARMTPPMTPALWTSRSHRNTDATAAPTVPIRPKPSIGMRSPGRRIASAIIAAIADSAMIVIGMMAA